MGMIWFVLGGLAGWAMSLSSFSPWPLRPTGDYAVLVVPYVLFWGAVAALAARLAGLRRVAVALAFAPGLGTTLVLAWFFAYALMHG
jgi:NhaP-type Na+/H+ or K+/H+ antiporter